MRNLNKPNRYNVASVQVQQTLGSDVMQSDEEGQYVEFRDYAWLLAEKQRLDALTDEMDKTINESQAGVRSLKAEVESLMTNPTSRLLRVEREQVERLTKAGDEVIREWSSGDEKEARNFMKALVIWNAAKGVQS